jgi:ADP-ribosyl-[dinitrogen reductase] hydrolase
MKSVDYLDKFAGTLLAVSIGDTLGHPFEGLIREDIYAKFKYFDEYLKTHTHLFNTYTDDTQLTLHTTQALVQGSGFKLDTFIREYVAWLEDPPIGPGYGCISSIRKLRYGIPVEKAASNSGGNGTAMRASPIGLFYCKDIPKLIEVSLKSSLITHTHPAASAGAIVIARAIAYLIDLRPDDTFPIEDFFNIIISSISGSNEPIWNEFIDILNKLRQNIDISVEAGLIKFSQIGVRSPYFIEEYLGKAFVHPYALSTAACAIFLFLKHLSSFRDCVYELATAGGDSDTVGAMGGSLAGAFFGLRNIPEDLIKLVKNSTKILQLSSELYNKYKERYG